MTETKPSKIVIEGDRVVKALRLAAAGVGVDEILQQTNATLLPLPHISMEKISKPKIKAVEQLL